jgi:LDH2 family malate/lactate/ureidoglycolate dehydrogenase
MIEDQLCASLDRRAGALLAAATFDADPAQVRTAAIVCASVTIARSHGIAGVEGYLAALNDVGSTDDGVAGRAIREAIDEAIVTVAAAAWSGGLPVRERARPYLERTQATRAA